MQLALAHSHKIRINPSDGGTSWRSLSTSLSPQTVSSGGDSGVDSYCDHMADLPSITLSLCGGLTDDREITKGKFLL